MQTQYRFKLILMCSNDFFFILQLLDDEISADFYIAVPDILSKLVPLKNKLRKRFPKSKRGKLSVSIKQEFN